MTVRLDTDPPTRRLADALRGAITEALKVITVRRNLIGIVLAMVVVLAQPWALLAAFGWLAQEGVDASPLEVLGLSVRNLDAGFLLMLLLGQQAYVSDASHGLLQQAVIGTRRRLGTAVDKTLFGALAALAIASVATLSSGVASRVVGEQPSQIPATYWARTVVVLSLALLLYYVIGLLTAGLIRSKALAVVVGVGTFWVFLPAVFSSLALGGGGGTWLRWILPTELAAATLAWVPGGNPLVVTGESVAIYTMLLLGWLGALTFAWLMMLRRRQFFPSEPS